MNNWKQTVARWVMIIILLMLSRADTPINILSINITNKIQNLQIQ